MITVYSSQKLDDLLRVPQIFGIRGSLCDNRKTGSCLRHLCVSASSGLGDLGPAGGIQAYPG